MSRHYGVRFLRNLRTTSCVLPNSLPISLRLNPDSEFANIFPFSISFKALPFPLFLELIYLFLTYAENKIQCKTTKWL